LKPARNFLLSLVAGVMGLQQVSYAVEADLGQTRNCEGTACLQRERFEQRTNPDGLGGWHILMPDYESRNLLDGISYEWDFYMIHDASRNFYATIGYLVSNPRGKRLLNLKALPEGGNVAFIAQEPGEKPVAQYVNFGLQHYQASADQRSFYAQKPGSEIFGKETPLRGGGPGGMDAIRLEGRTDDYAWDLTVSPEWGDRDSAEYRPVVGKDIGLLPQESWTVDVVWPRTKVQGTVTALKSNEVFQIDGHGYRENSWGRYALVVDGWDFYVFSEDRNALMEQGIDPNQGVSLTMQTYHKSTLLDYADISFYDQGELRRLRFKRSDGQMGWIHNEWAFNRDVHQCVPTDMELVLDNDDYRVEVKLDYPLQNHGALLSTATPLVAIFMIDEVFPHYQGTIINKKTGAEVRSFSGIGGGEFSFKKAGPFDFPSNATCARRLQKRFSAPLPQ
jgi:hypothetical protein